MENKNLKVIIVMWLFGAFLVGGIYILVNLKEGKLFRKDESVAGSVQTTNVTQVDNGSLQEALNEAGVSAPLTDDEKREKLYQAVNSLTSEEFEQLHTVPRAEVTNEDLEEDVNVLYGVYDPKFQSSSQIKVVDGFVVDKYLIGDKTLQYNMILGISGQELEIEISHKDSLGINKGMLVEIRYYYESGNYVVVSVAKKGVR